MQSDVSIAYAVHPHIHAKVVHAVHSFSLSETVYPKLHPAPVFRKFAYNSEKIVIAKRKREEKGKKKETSSAYGSLSQPSLGQSFSRNKLLFTSFEVIACA